MRLLLEALQIRFPQLRFTPGKTFVWSPETGEVFYKEPETVNTETSHEQANWSLLHETGHALLGHTSYQADIQLVKLEVAAWEKAKALAKDFDIVINEDHIQDCLDTYRDWLHRRSICPTCTTKCLQQSDMRHYRCFNCHTVWKVTSNRFARPYRAHKALQVPQPLVHASGLS